MTTNVPLPTFSAAGLSVPTEPDLLAGVFADYVDAFALSGKTLNTQLTTPQGQLAQSQAYMLNELNAGLLSIIAGVDPATASGAFQDALGRIYFLTRQPATYATVLATVSGVVGTTLPAGAQAVSPDGTIWASTGQITFGPGGTATVTFQATTAGAGPAVGVGGLRIYQQQPGWEGVSNALPSTPGADVESRQTFEARRADSVAIGGNGTAASVRAAIANVPGVTDVYVYNNGSDLPITYGATDYPIPAHSVAITVAGGATAAIGAAIHSKLDCGCGMPNQSGEGTLVSTVVEDSVNYAPPYPQYLVRFVRAAPVSIYFRVEVADLTSLPSSYVADVQQAIVSAMVDGFSTADGKIVLQRARLGGQIVAANYFAPIQALGSITPVTIDVGFVPVPTDSPAVTMGIDQLPVITALNIVVEAVPVV